MSFARRVRISECDVKLSSYLPESNQDFLFFDPEAHIGLRSERHGTIYFRNVVDIMNFSIGFSSDIKTLTHTCNQRLLNGAIPFQCRTETFTLQKRSNNL